MGRVTLGIILEIVGVGFFLFVIFGMETEPVRQLAESVLCQGEERLVMETTSRRAGSVELTALDCVLGDTTRDVMGLGIVLMAATLIVPSLLGALLIITGVTVKAREGITGTDSNRIAEWLKSPTNTASITVNGQPVQGADVPADVAKLMSQFLGGDPSQWKAISATGVSSLTAQLEEIKNALEQGLITQAEHDRLRQAILDRTADGS